MRFTEAWSKVLSQNVALRFTILCLSVSVIGLLVVLTKLSLRDPIVIERACISQALDPASTDRTQAEISAFIKEALAQRFDTTSALQDGFLSVEEAQFREQEQQGLKEKEMKQRVLVNQVEKVSGADITVDADRLISVGPVRSALPFALRLTVSSIPRSRGNPYGLKLIQVKPMEKLQDGERKNEK